MILKRVFLSLIIIVFLSGTIYYFFRNQKWEETNMPSRNEDSSETVPSLKRPKTINMQIQSSAFQEGEYIPSKYTCDGENISPTLKISGVPKESKSLALIVDDPDAPTGHWVHWVIWNINSETTEIPENSVPVEAVEGMTSFGRIGYGGPCPPSGTHRYFFKLYALDTELNLSSAADAKKLKKAMEGHILASVQLMGLYKRQSN